MSVHSRNSALRAGVAALMVAIVAAVSATPVCAQGVLGSQGLGFPPGQLSTHARATAGAISEFDPITGANPASMANWGRAAIHVQFEPEVRTTQSPSGSDITGITRFPMFAAGIGLGERVAIGVNFSTFLDRSWETVFTGRQIVANDTASFTDRNGVRGAITDSRFSIGVVLPFQLRVGVAIHALTGEHRLRSVRTYDTAATYVGYSSTETVRFAGRGLSLGVSWEPARWIGLAASARSGGALDAVNDAQRFRASGDMPNRWGIAARVEPARGLQLAARREQVQWSSLRPLVSQGTVITNTVDNAVGLEYFSTGVGGLPYSVRLGAAQRQLPFGVGSAPVDERALAGGLGLVLSQGRFGVDVSYTSATRTAPGNLRETAGTFSLGIVIRP
jgi:hypothetical protein